MSRPSHVFPAVIASAPNPEVINHTGWPAQYFQHVDPYGDIFHVVVARVTYSLPAFTGKEIGLPTLLPPEKQTPLCEADEFAGEINASSLIQESDYAPYKPKCDVLLVNATAYSPGGKPMERWPVGFRFGNAIEKYLQVTGPRLYKQPLSALGGYVLGEPAACTSVPVCYELAFGGPNLEAEASILNAYAETKEPTETAQAQARASRQLMDELPARYQANPIGCGRGIKSIDRTRQSLARIKTASVPRQQQTQGQIEQKPLLAPQLEQFKNPYRGQRDYPVVGFGPIGRWWSPRMRLAGTHDTRWKQTQWPKSPLDHDYRYWNCAPEDQQIDYPQGGEEIVLAHLTRQSAMEGRADRLILPKQDLQLLVRLNVGVLMFAPMHIDTLIIDFKANTLSVVRRATVSAKTQVRQLELGTWPAGTVMELDEADRQNALAHVREREGRG